MNSRPPHLKPNQRPARPPVSRPSAKLRGHPKDSDDVRISKTLSWVLRHGAKSEGLFMREDGYVKVADLLALPKMKGMNFENLGKLVQDDAKQRYNLISEPSTDESAEDVWWIRANQGHSLQDVDLQHDELKEAGQVPMAVHGTTMKAWKSIATEGLSRMTRQHIHFAQGVAGGGVISGMRQSSQVLIYVDLESALDAGLKFYISKNGVVLTPGNEHGFLAPEFFMKVEHANGRPMPDWTRPTQSSVTVDTIELQAEVSKLAISEEKGESLIGNINLGQSNV